jgi:hypothetical protein
MQVEVGGGKMIKCDFCLESDCSFENRLYNSCVEVDGMVYAIDQISGELLTINMNLKTISIDPLQVCDKPKLFLSKIIHRDSTGMIYERNGFVTLNDYIEYVKGI